MTGIIEKAKKRAKTFIPDRVISYSPDGNGHATEPIYPTKKNHVLTTDEISISIPFYARAENVLTEEDVARYPIGSQELVFGELSSRNDFMNTEAVTELLVDGLGLSIEKLKETGYINSQLKSVLKGLKTI